MECKLSIDRNPFQFTVEGEFDYGANQILFNERGVLQNVRWQTEGYSIENILNEQEFKALRNSVHEVLTRVFKREGLGTPPEDLSDYHKIVDNGELHDMVMSQLRFLRSSDLALDTRALSERVSKILNKEVRMENPKLEEEFILLRISRPDSMDINPLHRDGYLDIWTDSINVWIPIAGCNAKSSLPLIPGSHYWNESTVMRTAPRGASIGEQTYHAPGIVSGPEPLQAIRPNPAYGKALLFSPYLVHGAAINQNHDITRLSLELRLSLV